MPSRRLRQIARLTLVAILIVHLRLHALVDVAVAASAQSLDGQEGAAPSSCCCCPGAGKAATAPAADPADGDDKRSHPAGCPCCPQGPGGPDCCIFCVYAKAPCGPFAAALGVPIASELTGRVVETSRAIPPPPLDEFFQPPRA